jgi:hypothetical protein
MRDGLRGKTGRSNKLEREGQKEKPAVPINWNGRAGGPCAGVGQNRAPDRPKVAKASKPRPPSVAFSLGSRLTQTREMARKFDRASIGAAKREYVLTAGAIKTI